MSPNEILFSKLKKDNHGDLKLVLSLKIKEDFTWTVSMEGVNISTCPLVSDTLPVYIRSVSDVGSLITYLDCCYPCIGNNDEKYKSLVDSSRWNLQGTVN